MTSATTIKEESVIRVDKSRTYEINAGKCEHCGNFKTWEFRVQNPKSGKMMPGHVTAEGFKINNGDCPYWAAMMEKRESNDDSDSNDSKKPAISKGTLKMKSSKAPEKHLDPSSLKILNDEEGMVIIEVSTKPVTRIKISKDEAKELVFQIASAFD